MDDRRIGQPRRPNRQARAAEMLERVHAARDIYAARWSLDLAGRIDKNLHARFLEQQEDWNAAVVIGAVDAVELQGEAMIRAWQALTACVEGAQIDDDAYLVGACDRTGQRVVIGWEKSSLDRARMLHGGNCVHVTPDEVARLVGAAGSIIEIKQLFEGAEIEAITPRPLDG